MTTAHIMPTYYNQMPVAFDYGQGVWLWDTNGKKYLDSLSGIAVCSLGHAHPAITEAIVKQAGKLIHTSNTYRIAHQVELADELARVSGMEQIFFANSGAEANECAIKLTRLYARKKNLDHPVVITMRNSFHGRTMATLSATGSDRIQMGFEPLMPSFLHVNLNDIAALELLAKTQKNIIAIMLEPVQGDGGLFIAEENYLAKVRALCDEHDWLMILDEVQTGIGRTGKWFCYQHTNIMPDIVTSAKALGNGVPIGACLARGKAMNLFAPGKHGSTFGGNPLVCAVALAVLHTIEKENLLQHATQMGEYLQTALRKTFANQPGVVAVRGKGLMIGVELKQHCMDIVALALEKGLLINVVSNNVIRLLPPIVLTKEEADELVKRLAVCVNEFVGRQVPAKQ